MNIAINARVLIKDKIEGVGRYVYETSRRLAEQHADHTFYFFFDRPWPDSFVFSSNVKPVLLRPPARHPVLYIIWFEWSMRLALKKFNIDVLYTPDGFMPLNTQVPIVMVCHDLVYTHHPNFLPYKDRYYLKKFMPKFLAKANKVLAVSQFVKDDIVQQFPHLDAAKIEVAYNALPGDRTNPDPKLESKYNLPNDYFLCISSIHPRKNILGLLHAFEIYQNSFGGNYKLILVGNTYWKLDSEIIQKIEKLLQNGSLIHLQNVKDQDIVSIICKAKAMMYVSLFEGFGIPILEGMANGIPVITSNITSMPEVAGDAAILVDPYNHLEIAQAMHRITTEPDLVNDLIKKGHERVKQFNWNTSTEIIYKSILAATNKLK